MVNTIPKSAHHLVLIGKESTYGTAVSTTKDIGLIQTFDFNESNNTEQVFSSSSREAVQVVDNQFTGEFTSEFLYQHGRIFDFIFGGTTTHAETSGDWKHTFSVGTDVPSMTIEHSYNLSSDIVRKLTGAKLSELVVDGALGERLKVRISGKHANSTDSTSASSAVVSTIPVFTSYNLHVKAGSAGAESDVGVCEKFTLSLKHNLDVYEGVSNRTAQEMTPDHLEVDFEFTLKFNSVTEYERFKGGTSASSSSGTTGFSLIISADNGVTLGSGRRELYFNLTDTHYKDYGEAKPLKGYVLATIKGHGIINTAYAVDNISDTNWL